jgi:hypothetical protein
MAFRMTGEAQLLRNSHTDVWLDETWALHGHYFACYKLCINLPILDP